MLKKFTALILVLVMCLSLCACGKPTQEDAVADADKIVSKWNSNLELGFGYKCKYDTEEAGGPYYTVYVRDVTEQIANFQNPAYMRNVTIKEIHDKLYPQIAELLEPYGICVIFILSNSDGSNSYSGIVDNEITHFD